MNKNRAIEIFMQFHDTISGTRKPVYLVGGSVRDILTNRDINDIDIASAMLPVEMMDWADKNGWHAIPTGIEHGTVTLIKRDVKVEHTTFRRDVSTDGRNATVEFSESVFDDLARRDFTMNAIAMSIGGQKIDPFNGELDILKQEIRCVGAPGDRFKEDLLRPIRAARLAAKMGYTIRPEVWVAMIECAPEITKHVSFERIRDEFEKSIGSTSRGSTSRFIRALDLGQILQEVIPEFDGHDSVMHKDNDFHFGESNLEHTMQVADRAENPTELWSAICHDLGKKYTNKGDGTFHGHGKAGVADATSVCDRFKLPNKVRDFVLDLTEHHMRVHMAKGIGAEAAARLVDAFHGRIDEAMNFVWKQDQLNSKAEHSGKEHLEVLRAKNLLKPAAVVTGDDILGFGIPQGPKVGIKLAEAYRLQLQGYDRDHIIRKMFRGESSKYWWNTVMQS